MTSISTLAIVSLEVRQDGLSVILGDFEIVGERATSGAKSAVDESL